MTLATPDRTGIGGAYRELRSIRTIDDVGLATYKAGAPDEGRHVLQLPRGTYRTLLRDESAPWCDGLDVASGHSRVAELAGAAVPKLLTLNEASDHLPISRFELNRLTRAGGLYPLYGRTERGQGRVRYLFASQVHLEALTRQLEGARSRRRNLEKQREEALTVWLAQRRLLPPPIHESTVDVDLRPLPSPNPLPLDPSGSPEPRLCIEALLRADEAGWLEYRHPTDTGDAYVVVVHLAGVQVKRRIPQRWLLAWLLGVADGHGRPDLVAFRLGLGG